jgi:hypothetical protein
MYTAVLPTATQPFLLRSTDGGASIMDAEAIRHIGLIAMKARPFYEYTREITTSQLLANGVLSEEIFPDLEKYLEEWASDANIFLLSEKASHTSQEIFRHALNFFEQKARTSILIPNEKFHELLPINSEWMIIARIIAAGVEVSFMNGSDRSMAEN